MLDWFLNRASRQTRYWLTGNDESWCAAAWKHREVNFIAKQWCKLFPRHCEQSYRRYYR